MDEIIALALIGIFVCLALLMRHKEPLSELTQSANYRCAEWTSRSV